MAYKIGFMGSAGRDKELSGVLLKLAQDTGKLIAKMGHTLVTGACMGTPYAASEGAMVFGGKIIWFSPAQNLKEHISKPLSYPEPLKPGQIVNPGEMSVVYTGLGKIGRIPKMIEFCDGVIFCSGHAGTLVEFSVAYHEGKVIGYLKGSGGIADQIPQLVEMINKNTGAVIIGSSSPSALVSDVIRELNERRKK